MADERKRIRVGKRECRRVAPLLRPYVEGELEGEEAAGVREHLAACPACTRHTAEVGALIGALRGLPAGEMRPDFSSRLDARLAQEPLGRPSRWRRLLERAASGRGGFPLGVTAAAAVVILLLTGWLLRPSRITAQEVTTRVQASWARLSDYHCTLKTTCCYRGGTLTTTREQWFRKPDHFRIESDEGQRRVTYINGDEVVTYLPDSGIAIHRPRRASEPDLPFPFRSAADLQSDITVDALLKRLRETKSAELAGREEVLGKSCYVLTFRALKPPARNMSRPRAFDCRMWVDGDTFLGLRLHMHYNDRMWSDTQATGLEVNRGLEPERFVPSIPAGVKWLRGDVEPRLFEHHRVSLVNRSLDARRAATAVRERVGFSALIPSWLPQGYRVVSASTWQDLFGDRSGRRYTLTLLNDAGNAITVIQEPPVEEQARVREALLSTESGTHPYAYVRLTGIRAGIAVRIMAANLRPADTIHLLRALRTAEELAASPTPDS